MQCKKCSSEKVIKNGKVRGKQRFLCQECRYNFIETDMRTRPQDVEKRALAVLLYTMCKASYNFLGTKLFKVSPTTIMNWIKKEAKTVEIPAISGDIKEMEFDEMWHFIDSKKLKNGSSRPLIVARGKLLPMLSVTVILQHLRDCTTK